MIARITHRTRLSVFESYYRQTEWEPMCAEVAELKIDVPEWAAGGCRSKRKWCV